ncbi:MAG: hypothetical protein ABW019_12250 [Chitinophagaceae bacterium]
MKGFPAIQLLAYTLIALPVLFSACVKDNCKKEHTYVYYQPVFKTKNEVRANIKSNAPRAIETPGKICILGPTIFLNEPDRGIHIIDNTNPARPRNIAFVDIPGNMDIAIKGNILYADLFTDLVALDISNPADVKVKKIVEGVFPYRVYGNGFVQANNQDHIITEWVRRDTTVTESCSEGDVIVFFDSNVFLASSASGGTASPVGKGGSMARFTIMNNRLYTVGTDDLDVFNITNAADPVHGNRVSVGWNIETIYPFKNNLFIGSQTGMFIYNVTNPDVPVQAGQFSHVRSCDPVIADDNYAYVTLRSGNVCQGFTNELDIVKLNNLSNPALQKVYPLTNPHGLSKDGDLLFICDGKDGLKVYNAANVMSLQLISTIGTIDAYDVIAMDHIALTVAKDGLYQYDYSDPVNIRLLSKLTVAPK